MAGDFEKPNKVHTLYPEEIEAKFWPLPVRDLFLVGAATERKLNRLGIYTIGDLNLRSSTFFSTHSPPRLLRNNSIASSDF